MLDSGVLTGHPLLSPAIGDAQSFLSGEDAADEHGHGTHGSWRELGDEYTRLP